MLYNSNNTEMSYNPPILGNGDIALGVDREGTLNYERVGRDHPSACIFRAGRRLLWQHDIRPPAKLLSFGSFAFERGSEVTEWTQELKETDGLIETNCQYADGAQITSVCLVHPSRNLYAMQKQCRDAEGTVSFRYTLKGYNDKTTEAIEHLEILPMDNGARVRFRMHGQDMYTGEVMVWLDRDAEVVMDGDEVTFSTTLQAEDTVCLYIALEDDLFTEHPTAVNDAVLEWVRTVGFDGVRAETVQNWNAYFSECGVTTGDAVTDSAYRVALYHLRCYTTRWSIPVGVNDCSWDGKFFAFDEYYSFLGLLTAGRTELAKRVPAFRARVCLEKAIERASKHTDNVEQARFCWETSEYGEELSTPGFWYDHVFHMAVVALGAFEYYEFTQDRDFLEECYRLIRSCAQFYTQTMLYTDQDGGVFVGKCSDLERLGASVQNAFMTSCGIIKTLECLVAAADVLGVDREYRDQCEKLSLKLRASLPRDGEKYLPYPDCQQRSIGVFAGKFPFNVLDAEDPYLLPAWEDFLANESAFGNMYKVGKRVSSWYACWKAEAYARIGNAAEAYMAQQQALLSLGAFHEMYEINEPGSVYRPWFTTAAGIYLSAVNEMLVQSDGENIYLLPAYPQGKGDVAFRLPVKGGAVVDVTAREGEPPCVQVMMREGVPARRFNVYFRGQLLGVY